MVKYANIKFIFRKLLVADYIQKCESEMEKIKTNIEHLSEQEARWQKLESYIKRSFQLQHSYLDEMSEW
jgi:hypothetical protein